MIKKIVFSLATMTLFSGCASTHKTNSKCSLVVSIPQQKMVVYKDNCEAQTFPVSTSKFGLGSTSGSYKTPLGKLKVANKVGDGAPVGMVFKGGRKTGEIVKPGSPGRDPIITRVIMLNGQETSNKNALSRGIFIHGTPEEIKIGSPASYGCIRMKSKDIIELYNELNIGAPILITNSRI